MLRKLWEAWCQRHEVEALREELRIADACIVSWQKQALKMERELADLRDELSVTRLALQDKAAGR